MWRATWLRMNLWCSVVLALCSNSGRCSPQCVLFLHWIINSRAGTNMLSRIQLFQQSLWRRHCFAQPQSKLMPFTPLTDQDLRQTKNANWVCWHRHRANTVLCAVLWNSQHINLNKTFDILIPLYPSLPWRGCFPFDVPPPWISPLDMSPLHMISLVSVSSWTSSTWLSVNMSLILFQGENCTDREDETSCEQTSKWYLKRLCSPQENTF